MKINIVDMGIDKLQEEFGLSYNKAKKLHKIYCKYPDVEGEYVSEGGQDVYDKGNVEFWDVDLEDLIDEPEEFFMRV